MRTRNRTERSEAQDTEDSDGKTAPVVRCTMGQRAGVTTKDGARATPELRGNDSARVTSIVTS